MFEPCGDHVWPSLTSRPARVLKFSRLIKHGLRPMSSLRVNLATFWSCSFLLFVMCKGWHDNVSVWATARIVPGFAQHTSWSGHYIYTQQHFARIDTQAVLVVTPAGLPTHHHTGSIPYLLNIRVMFWSNMKTRKKQTVLQ